jgi:outer membrane protein OmpA-like peptidoglycan-associated protein
MIKQQTVLMSVAAAGLLVFSTGCATKKHVRATVAPVEARVGEVEKRATQAEADVDALEKQLSQTTEIANGAEREAKNATQLANKAGSAASTAQQRADSAYGVAEKNTTRIGEVETNLTNTMTRMYENLDNYQMVKSESITFGFNRADLTKDMQAKLNEFATGIKEQKRFVVEVQGYTDPAGPTNYNQELAQRRAMAVVRYLATEHQIPLRRIQMLGFGEVNPVADNKTRQGRMQNRRVDLKVFALPADAKSEASIAKSLE